MNKVTLKDLHEVYKKYLHIEDTNRLDVVLAVALSVKNKGTSIWLILVGPSGDMKSVQLNAIMGWDRVFVLHGLTSKTLVNGSKNKKKAPDLAPKLNNKLVVIQDMAQILEMHPQQKAELWGQLRDLFDGYAGKCSGQGSTAKYSDIYVTLLAGSTPAIDSQILIHQNLGTRELVYRTSGNQERDKLIDKCFENLDKEARIKRELKEITESFLEQTELKENISYSEEIIKEIKRCAIYVSYMRASADFDSYTHELRNAVYPEQPTRVAKQLMRLYGCLISLDENYSSETALAIIKHISESSAVQNRVRIYEFLVRHLEEYTTTQLSQILNLGKATIKRECAVLESLKILFCRREEIPKVYDRFIENWQINREHELLKDDFKLDIEKESS